MVNVLDNLVIPSTLRFCCIPTPPLTLSAPFVEVVDCVVSDITVVPETVNVLDNTDVPDTSKFVPTLRLFVILTLPSFLITILLIEALFA